MTTLRLATTVAVFGAPYFSVTYGVLAWAARLQLAVPSASYAVGTKRPSVCFILHRQGCVTASLSVRKTVRQSGALSALCFVLLV
jgi:hypothetical protein